MTSLIILQITSLMCFIYSLKVKMYVKNLVGFVATTTMFISIIPSYFDFCYQYAELHYILISALLLFIMIYHTYKSFKRNVLTKENN